MELELVELELVLVLELELELVRVQVPVSEFRKIKKCRVFLRGIFFALSFRYIRRKAVIFLGSKLCQSET